MVLGDIADVMNWFHSLVTCLSSSTFVKFLVSSGQFATAVMLLINVSKTIPYLRKILAGDTFVTFSKANIQKLPILGLFTKSEGQLAISEMAPLDRLSIGVLRSAVCD
jgi:hypothetical protein